MHTKEQIDKLWKLLEPIKNLHDEEYDGLKSVRFDLDLNVFEIGYKNILYMRTANVISDIDKALEILSKVGLQSHHISCLSDSSSLNHNTALNIYYRNGIYDNNRYAIAIPGINYILSPSTQRELRRGGF